MKTPYPGDQVLDIDQALAAATRYEKKLPEASADPAPPADPQSRRRKKYVLESLSAERARAIVAEAEAHPSGPEPVAAAPAPGPAPTAEPTTVPPSEGPSPVIVVPPATVLAETPTTAQDTLSTLAQERIIGSSDLQDINYLELAVAVARAVCRIRIGAGAGTGFLVGPGLVMTNNHVIRSADAALTAEAQFDYQENASGELLPVQSFRFDPARFFVTDPVLDFTVVAVQPTSGRGVPVSGYPWVQLIATLGKAEAGEPVNIVQHPRGGLKQVALRSNDVILIPSGKSDFLYYTTDTEPGSSGSPCFNDQWELIALHHSGVPRTDGDRILRRDGTPWDQAVDDPGLIDWIANEGARVSAIVASLRAMDLAQLPADLREEMLTATPPNPVELARRGAPGPERMPSPSTVVAAGAGAGAGVAVPGPGGSVSFTVPLTVTVSLGTAAAPGGALPLGAAGASTDLPPDSTLQEVAVDADWGGRRGYDPGFLGIRVPLPRLSRAMKARSVVVPERFRVGRDRHVLAYHHFSLAMNSERRFAWYSAANVDGQARPDLPRRRDRWFVDPRIDDPRAPVHQLGEDLYAAKNTDRGHLTRYADVAWGTVEEAMAAAADSFHFTNACLQLDGFNQRTARWQGIEQFLLERKATAEQRRISVATGPVFRASDPAYRNDHMDAPARIPLAFWKVCALVRPDGTLSATAFVLDQQDITGLPGFEATLDVATVQTTVAAVEELTGLTFPVLRDHDHLAAGGDPGTLEVSGRRVIPIRAYDDIMI
ncbi:DNA/RNA non-specific endonuclease [Ornithinimicrobium tianjinense]|uniref:Serine protease n=1 Tax=Ornithinimicrobium tianjinense TaxID=1195761 RepID=A0A917BVK1_9MICO|nr:DNA/RNA non-specific endonuclease [Ornithinimicrobium tianjinense]GGF56313.1 hypothetical protein GCM10011366_25240 [Ornithinimicrobium tianjinense]